MTSFQCCLSCSSLIESLQTFIQHIYNEANSAASYLALLNFQDEHIYPMNLTKLKTILRLEIADFATITVFNTKG